MPRRAAYTEIYMDEAEGFLLQHALVSPPRTWPPLAPSTQNERLAATRKKMDWDGEVRLHPDDPLELELYHKIAGTGVEEDANKERCVICLMALRDRTVVGVCGHEFCFECIGVWANQSRRCPLCSAEMASFLLHDLDSISPTKFYLPPLPQRKLPSASVAGGSGSRDHERWGGRREKVEPDELDMAVERRREVYQHGLFAKHIGSNPTTRFRPNPTPRQIADEPMLIQRATAFMRRELRIWSIVDTEFLTTYILSLLKAIDIRSDPAIRLLAEYLDDERYPRAAEHFAHELYSFLRSPFKDLRKYDDIAQYDSIPSPRSRSPSRSRSPAGDAPRHSRSPEASGSRSRSPSPLSRSPSPYSSRSASSRSHSRSRSRSRSRLRSRSPLSPRQFDRRDTFIPSPPPEERRWDEADSWLDPEYAAWLEDKKRKAHDRLERKRAKFIAAGEERQNARGHRVELLPSPPPTSLRMGDDFDSAEATPVPATSALSIKGAAKDSVEIRRLTLLERLAKAKAESAVAIIKPQPSEQDSHGHGILAMETSARSDIDADIPPPTIIKGRGKEVVRARIALKMKLENEKQSFRRNVNESKAQELRRRLLETKARREAEETDATLRELDRIDRAKEVRRRLMVLKMMAAETEVERRARELRERLLARKRESIRV